MRIEEDYVTFKTAKLLREKGFNESTYNTYYQFDDGAVYMHHYNFSLPNSENDKNEWSCPTLQMTLKWLREIHQIYISIECCYDKSVYYTFDIFRVKDNKYEFIGCSGPDEDTDDCSVDYSYEKAENRAIDYCLIHLL